MASPRPAATIRRLAAFSLVLIVALLLSQVSTPASNGWMGSQAPRLRLLRLHRFGRRDGGQGAARLAVGHQGVLWALPEHPNASYRCRRWENLNFPPGKESAMEAWIQWMLRPSAAAPKATV